MYRSLNRRSIKSQNGNKPVPPATMIILPGLNVLRDSPVPLEQLRNKLSD